MCEKERTLPTSPTKYPAGGFVWDGSSYLYINGQIRHLIKNERILSTWNFRYVTNTTPEAVSGYVKGKPLGFRDGSLIRDISDGKVYLISGKQRRLMSSPEAFDLIGLKRRDALWVAHDEINLHPEGEVL